MEFTFIKGGCFEMGDTWNQGSKDEQPVHVVCIDSFFMGTYEVTQRQWKKIMGDNASTFQQGDDYSIENVTCNEAHTFITKLNSPKKNKYRRNDAGFRIVRER